MADLDLTVSLLGFLRTKLADLKGYRILANELIQNADDAKDPRDRVVDSLVFDICSDALVVRNNGSFREEDFDRIKEIASGGKVDEDDTTGSWGIGFISVYQITDHPELYSSGRKWTFVPEEKKVRVEPYRDDGHTVFRLPWARDPNSAIRQRLRVQAVDDKGIEELFQVLNNVVPPAILFQKKLRHIEIRRDGHCVNEIRLESTNGKTNIFTGGESLAFRKFSGTFTDEELDLRKRHGSLIEKKRKSIVTVAIAEDSQSVSGRLYACLPTEHVTGLPFHINADFYPDSSRKEISFADDYTGEWNRAALRSAADIVACHVDDLLDLFDPVGFWGLVDSVYRLHSLCEDGQKDPVYQEFWLRLKPQLEDKKAVWTFSEQWAKADAVVYRDDKTDEQVVHPLLHELGVECIHPDLRGYRNVLTSVGVPLLSTKILADALSDSGLSAEDAPVSEEAAPGWFRQRMNREQLAEEIERLLARAGSSKGDLKKCCLTLSAEGSFCTPGDVWRAPSDVVSIFSDLGAASEFADPGNPEAIISLSPEFNIDGAVSELQNLDSAALAKHWTDSPETIVRLIDWLSRSSDVRSLAEATKKNLISLPIWPSKHSLHPLSELVIPSNRFKDALGLSNIVSDRILKYSSFLSDMGAEELTVDVYARTQVPFAFSDGRAVPAEVVRDLVATLAQESGHLSNEAWNRLRDCPLVECKDGQFRVARDVYFDNDIVKSVLGSRVNKALVAEWQSGNSEEFLQKLGVHEAPTTTDILKRIHDITSTAPTDARKRTVQRLFGYLARCYASKPEALSGPLSELQEWAWLPGKEDASKWFVPSALHADYNLLRVFWSQVEYLDIPKQNDRDISAFLQFLGVNTRVDYELIVRHILYCIQNAEEIPLQVYRTLSQGCQSGSVSIQSLQRLENTSCLHICTAAGMDYVSPKRAFWGDHHMPGYCHKLGAEWYECQKLLSDIGVREVPGVTDAVDVLIEISDLFGAANRSLPDQDFDVLMRCWETLAASNNDYSAILCDRKVVPNDDRILCRPDGVFFEDKPKLKEMFFDVLKDNVIHRPPVVWPAMEACGVRSLSQAISVELVEPDLLDDDGNMMEWIRARWKLITRIVEADSGSGQWNLSIINDLKVAQTTDLTLNYKLEAFGGMWPEQTDHVLAYFDSSSRTLCYQASQPAPLTDISRELCYALNPDPASARISASIREVLRASSLLEASLALDDLGIPRIQELEEYVLGDDEQVGGVPDAEEDEELAAINDTEQEAVQSAVGEWEDEEETAVDETGTAAVDAATADSSAVSEDGNGRHERVTPHSQGHTYGSGGQVRGDLGIRSHNNVRNPFQNETEHTRSESRDWKSFPVGVFPHGSQYDDENESERAQSRTMTDRAGIAAVMWLERKEGRHPTKMKHTNPGYDVESRLGNMFAEEVERYIEVKSRTGEWDYVGLTDKQFEAARLLGEKYWIYVVEEVSTDQPKITAIQDPAGKANRFIFTPGWKEVGKEETIPAGVTEALGDTE